ncbi:hypothetical protein BC937DRAFT_86650 [Endogone sp. FLAS-F59071]|nr:hypothetical protein BC937DRAFT_86650 [Endogone sp. FLAS-F59071]|eukprot:RUS19960.1 hypothetical protein BC937DRAFT_86650 [Endogone sp. FLAS-F59071]
MSEPTTPTKPKAPVQDPNTPLLKRVYIGGLNNDVTAAELEERFRPFGNVANVDVARNTLTGHCRGFAHMTMNTTVGVNLYNGTKWKGTALKIEDAKSDYRERLRKEWENQKEEENEGNKPLKKRKKVTSDGVLAKDMTLVTDKNMEGRKNWKRGRYGRAIALLHLRKDDGTSFVYDPTHYKNNLLKLYNLGVKMKPTRQLAMYYEYFDKEGIRRDYASDSSAGEDGRGVEVEDEATPITPKSLIRDATVTKEMSNQQRLEALKKRQEERQTEQKKISAALANLESGTHKKGHFKFGGNEESNEDVPIENGEETDDSDMRTWTKRTREEGPAKQALKTLFDSDDGDSEREFDLEINPVFEGEAGRDRLNLQKRFGGDARFKLGEDFMDDGDDDGDENPAISQRILSYGATNDDVTKELTEEKSRAMDVLRSMFGEEKKTVTLCNPPCAFSPPLFEKPKQPAWSQATRFDPDAANADAFLLSSYENTLENEQIATDELPSTPIWIC